MAEGLGRERWAHTSLICALIANANRDPKKHRPFKPSDFDPYARHRRWDTSSKQTASKHDLKLLREALEQRKGSSHGR
jgi:hypothetical protein